MRWHWSSTCGIVTAGLPVRRRERNRQILQTTHRQGERRDTMTLTLLKTNRATKNNLTALANELRLYVDRYAGTPEFCASVEKVITQMSFVADGITDDTAIIPDFNSIEAIYNKESIANGCGDCDWKCKQRCAFGASLGRIGAIARKHGGRLNTLLLRRMP